MALYRKYRPASFSEVVGQEQVTRPLSVALDSGRINHAYLFSGPRGCGKTSSARILARSLNCEQGPTSTPCGVCPSCVALAPGGPGTLDVTELDAASNNGVDDMRELRDRAQYAPAESRYRIFIIDEAHMISNQGANALLKIVEEPPEHVVFVFATTEPEKVIGTIRSRTHHYPFRLLTPQTMRGLLERTVAAEGVSVEDSVYPLIVRAGGGSPRDTLSILDQLLAGAGPDGLTYSIALPLLGVTDLSLIDAAVDALATTDKAGLFQTVDDVIEQGHDPRRFIEDLLDRFRDLMLLQAVPDAISMGLVDAPTDLAEVLTREAAQFNGAQLTRLAAQLNEGLTEIRGATSPRLLLEILCARMLLPVGAGVVDAGAAQGASSAAQGAAGAGAGQAGGNQTGAQAGATYAGSGQPGSGQPGGRPAYERPSVRRAREEAEKKARQQQAQQQPQQQPQQEPQQSAEPRQSAEPQPAKQLAEEKTTPAAPAPNKPEHQAAAPAEPRNESRDNATKSADAGDSGDLGDEALELRSKWDELLGRISRENAATAIILQSARVLAVGQRRVVLGHNTGALVNRINDPAHNPLIVKVLSAELGREVEVEAIVGTRHDSVDLGDGHFVPTAKDSEKKPAWNPHVDDSEKPELPKQETREKEAQQPVQEQEPRREQPKQRSQAPQNQAPQSQAPQKAVWGKPRQIGGGAPDQKRSHDTDDPSDSSPAERPAPAARNAPAAGNAPSDGNAPSAGNGSHSEGVGASPREASPREASPREVSPGNADGNPSRRRWQQAAERGQAQMNDRANRPAFNDGVPLPPEPGPDYGDDFDPGYEAGRNDYPEAGGPADAGGFRASVAGEESAPGAQTKQSEHPAHSTQPERPAQPAQPEHPEQSEEEMMMEEARQPGNLDHRDAMTIAVELVEAELGARRM